MGAIIVDIGECAMQTSAVIDRILQQHGVEALGDTLPYRRGAERAEDKQKTSAPSVPPR